MSDAASVDFQHQQPDFELNLDHRFQRHQRRSPQYHDRGSRYSENHPSQLSGVHLSRECNQTAALTTFTVTMLADNPHVFNRLRDEVLNTLGSHGRVTARNLREMKYLRAVLNGELIPGSFRLRPTILTMASETLRLYPSV